MGVISDAIDALEDWCCDLFKDGIKSQFDGISDLLTDTFSQTTGSDGLVSTYLTNFTGGGTGGTSVWTTIETLCNNVVVPIAGFILTVILLNDLIQTVLRGNNFKDFDDSIIIKWISRLWHSELLAFGIRDGGTVYAHLLFAVCGTDILSRLHVILLFSY